jgi:hypothetical protein
MVALRNKDRNARLGTTSKEKPKAYKNPFHDADKKPDPRSEYTANITMRENIRIDDKPQKPHVRKYLGARRGRTKTGNVAHPIEIYKEESDTNNDAEYIMKNDMASINAEMKRRKEAQRTVVSRYLRLTRRTSDD